MGQRGINATPVNKVNAEFSARDIEQPWDDPSLTRAERVKAFLETLPVTSGAQRGTKFRVRDWQWREIILPIYSTDDEGVRYVREAILSFPRKNGKTGLVAGLALCHLCGPEAVERGQVKSAANARKQAGLIFNEMAAIVKRVYWMAKRINVKSFTKEMHDVVTDSTFEALAAEVATEHGLSPSFWIYDELGQAKDRKLYDVLATSQAAWEEPLGIVISTQSPDPKHIMSELVDDGLKILEGSVEDRTRYACIFSADMKADPWSEETWRACNPALGDFRSLEEMRAFAAKAQRIPAMEATFRNLYLNQRVDANEPFIPAPEWAACAGPAELFTDEALAGLPCVGSIDLSGTGKNDLTAYKFLFEHPDGRLLLKPYFFAAADGLEIAEARDRVPYRQWVKEGHLIAHPGKVLDYKFLAERLGEFIAKYRPTCIAVDPWNIERLTAECETLGIDAVLYKWGQSYQHMDPAIKAFVGFVISRKLVHDGNPIDSWCLSNVKVGTDSSGNQKLDKRKATGRIDGAQASAMACGLYEISPAGESYASAVID